jgi:uncharacterized membrane protein YoaK (UPF0700 family)
MPVRRRRDLTAVLRAIPFFVALLGIIAASVGASLQGLPWPRDVAAVFVVIGIGATWLNRATPLRGAFFVLVLSVAVVGVVYGG